MKKFIRMLDVRGLCRRKKGERLLRRRIIIIVIALQLFYVFHLSRTGIQKRKNFTSENDKDAVDFKHKPSLKALRPTQSTENPVSGWSKKGICQDQMVTYSTNMAVFKNISLFKSKLSGLTGGQNMSEIMNIPEKKEFYTLQKGVFNLYCPSRTETFNRPKLDVYLGDYLKNVEFSHKPDQSVADVVYRNITLMVTRIEYANVYWTVMESYDAYLTLRAFGINPLTSNASILIFDGHPNSGLDMIWKLLTPNILRVGNLQEHSKFSTLIWQFTRKTSPMLLRYGKSLPLMNDYVSLYYKRCGIVSHRDCKRPKILFIWRHDYVAHPRNPSGLVSRKITNEQELLNATKQRYRSVDIQGVQLDRLPLCEQLRLIAETDVVVGMHGAAMALVLFMKSGSSVVEIYPPSYATTNWHMSKIAEWAGVTYTKVKIKDKKLEDKIRQTTIVKPSQVIEVLDKELKRICDRSYR